MGKIKNPSRWMSKGFSILHNRGHICDNNPIYYGNTVCEYDEQL